MKQKKFSIIFVNTCVAFVVLMSTIGYLLIWDKSNASSGALEVWDKSIAENFALGNGTYDYPYLISNGSELALLAKVTNSNLDDEHNGGKYNSSTKHYILTNDIILNDNLTSYTNWGTNSPANDWTPIGLSAAEYSFAANFDGNGFAIRGIYINATMKHVGLFGRVKGNAIISSVGVEQSYISSVSSTDTVFVGGIAGYVAGSAKILNSYNTGTVLSVGTATASAQQHVYAGGIAGSFSTTNGLIANCYNTGAISVNSKYGAGVGGITGHLSGGTGIIVNCYNTGALSRSGSWTYLGGVIGYRGPSGTNTAGSFSYNYFINTATTVYQWFNGSSVASVGSSGTNRSFTSAGVLQAVIAAPASSNKLADALNNWVTNPTVAAPAEYPYFNWTTTPAGSPKLIIAEKHFFAPFSGTGYTVSTSLPVNPDGSYAFTIAVKPGYSLGDVRLNTLNGSLVLTSAVGNQYTFSVYNVTDTINSCDFSIDVSQIN